MKSCPKCKSNMIIDIVYGYPSEEMSDAADSNTVVGFIKPTSASVQELLIANLRYPPLMQSTTRSSIDSQ